MKRPYLGKVFLIDSRQLCQLWIDAFISSLLSPDKSARQEFFNQKDGGSFDFSSRFEGEVYAGSVTELCLPDSIRLVLGRSSDEGKKSSEFVVRFQPIVSPKEDLPATVLGIEYEGLAPDDPLLRFWQSVNQQIEVTDS